MVFSTNPDFMQASEPEEEEVTPPPNRQQLRIRIDSRGRKGRTVTIVEGFTGKNDDLELLARELKIICRSGGSSKDKQIVIQGNFRERSSFT